jgi:hypothetical protein
MVSAKSSADVDISDDPISLRTLEDILARWTALGTAPNGLFAKAERHENPVST